MRSPDRIRAALDDLRWHWGEAYRISHDASRWHAIRRDNGTVLTGTTRRRLHARIVADYTARPVTRGLSPS